MPKDKSGHGSNKHSGALAAGGAVATGTGLVAGGIPGHKEAHGLDLFNLRANPDKKLNAMDDASRGYKASRATKAKVYPSMLNPVGPKVGPGGKRLKGVARLQHSHLGQNGMIMSTMGNSGILGYRSNVHEAFLKDKPAEEAKALKSYGSKVAAKGATEGKMTAERGVLRGMRAGRKASYALTIGGAGLAAKGLYDEHKKHHVSKAKTSRDRHEATVTGAAGLGAVGVGAPAGLGHFQRKYEAGAKADVAAATKIQPRIGGLRDAKGSKGLKPAMSGAQMAKQNIIGATKGKGNKRALAYHLGANANKVHFVDVFRSTKRGVAAAGLGGAAYLGHKAYEQHKEGVAKMAGHEAFLEISKAGTVKAPARKTAEPVPPEVSKFIADHKARVSKHVGDNPFEVQDIEKALELGALGGKVMAGASKVFGRGAAKVATGGAKLENTALKIGTNPKVSGATTKVASGVASAGKFMSAKPKTVLGGAALSGGAFGVGHHYGKN